MEMQPNMQPNMQSEMQSEMQPNMQPDMQPDMQPAAQGQEPAMLDFPQLQGKSPDEDVTGTDAELLERFVTNVMLLASDKQKKQMIGIAKSANTPQEALTKAMYFIIESVAKGLADKAIEIPPALYLAKNGIIMEATKIIATILDNNGIEITEQSVGESIVMVAQLIDERVSQGKEGDQGGAVPPGMHRMPDGGLMADADMPQGQAPQQQAPQQQAPQQQMPQGQAPQQAGLLSQGNPQGMQR